MCSCLTNNTAESLVNKCEVSGGAYIAGINVTNSAFSSFTEADWKTLVDAVHKRGYMLSYAYAGEQLHQLLMQCGFDIINSTRNINEIEHGNLINIDDTVTFDGFTTTGTISEGVLTLANGETIEPAQTIPTVFLGGSSLHITFNGTITLNMGDNLNGTFTSDGDHDMWFSTFVEESAPTFSITATEETEISSLSFKASEM